MGVKRNQFFDINRKFAEQFNYYVGFFLSDRDTQISVILNVYGKQDTVEKDTDSTIYKNGVGFAKSDAVSEYHILARKLAKNRTAQLEHTEISILRQMHRYFPQFFRTAPKHEMLAVMNRYSKYSDRCMVLEREMSEYNALTKGLYSDKIKILVRSLRSYGTYDTIKKRFNDMKNSIVQLEFCFN